MKLALPSRHSHPSPALFSTPFGGTGPQGQEESPQLSPVTEDGESHADPPGTGTVQLPNPFPDYSSVLPFSLLQTDLCLPPWGCRRPAVRGGENRSTAPEWRGGAGARGQ